MQPTPAETARTLLLGRLPAFLHLHGCSAGMPVAHGTDCAGQPLVLIPDDDAPAACARPVPAMLSATDVPPLARSPRRGQARAAGRLSPVPPAQLPEAVQEFAESNPAPELLDVGRGAALYRLDPERIRLDVGHTRHDIDIDAYIEAWPDPLHADERDLLLDLADHHAEPIDAYVARCLGPRSNADGPRLPVRLDRYGFTVDTHPDTPRWLRLNFPRPVRDRLDLADVLHPLLFHGHH